MTVYDPRGMAWDVWCKLMCELLAPQQLVPTTERNWRAWASAVVGNGYMAAQGAPDPRGFTDWQAWAKQLVGVTNLKGLGQ